MKRCYKLLIIIAILIILIGIIYLLVINRENKEEYILSVSELKKQIGITGEENLYDIVDAGNNVKSLSIKEEVKFKVSLAGMIKGEKPELLDVDKIIEEKKFRDKGIYIDKQSRNQFIQLIEKFTNAKYVIDEEGYLKLLNNYNINEKDKKIINQLQKNELLIIGFSDFCYIVDEVTGEVIDYPFEKMDPYQVSQTYRHNNQFIIFITTNSKKKKTEEEIFNEMF